MNADRIKPKLSDNALRPAPQSKPLTPKQGYGRISHKGISASEADIRRAARAAAAAKWRKRARQR